MLDHLNTLSTKTKKTRITSPLKMAFPFSHDISNDHKGGNLSPLINSLASSTLCGLSRITPLLTMTFTRVQNRLSGYDSVKIHRVQNWILQRLNLAECSYLVRGDQKGSLVWTTVVMDLQLDGLSLPLNETNRVHVVLLNSKETTKNSSLMFSQVHCSNKLLKQASIPLSSS